MLKTSLVSSFIHNHGIFHIIPCVGNNRNDSIGSLRCLCKVILGMILCSDHWGLWEKYTVDFVIHTIRVIVIWSTHCLLCHLALIHVTWRLVVVGKRNGTGDDGEHVDWVHFLMSWISTEIFFKTSDWEIDLLERANEFYSSTI